MSRNYYTNRSRRTTTILTLGILVAAFAIGMTVFLVKKNNKTTNKGEDNTWQNSSQIDQATQRDDLELPSLDGQNEQQSSSSSASQQETSQSESQTSEQSQTSQQAQTFSSPVAGEIINNCSMGELVRDTTMNDWRTHNGIDIACDTGSTVYAAANGTVTDIYDDDMWGTVVTIDFGNNITGVYKLLSPGTIVSIGQSVNCGDQIGTVAENCVQESTLETHLHFEMLSNGEYVNPADYF